jgi:hypothetical protein
VQTAVGPPEIVETEEIAIIDHNAGFLARAQVGCPCPLDKDLGSRAPRGASRPVFDRKGHPGEEAVGQDLELFPTCSVCAVRVPDPGIRIRSIHVRPLFRPHVSMGPCLPARRHAHRDILTVCPGAGKPGRIHLSRF